MKPRNVAEAKTEMEQHSTFLGVVDEDNHDTKPKHSLFPSAINISKEKSRTASDNGKKGLDWLKNKSFTADTAQKFVEFQEEFKLLQAGESDTRSAPGQTSSSASTVQSNHPDTSIHAGRDSSGKPASYDDKVKSKIAAFVKSARETSDYTEGKERERCDDDEKSDSKSRKQKRRDEYDDSAAIESPERGHNRKNRHKNSSDVESPERGHKKKNKYKHSSDCESPERGRKKKKKNKYTSDSDGSSYSHQHKKKKKSKHKKKKDYEKVKEDLIEKTREKSKSNTSSSSCKKLFLEEFEDLKPEDAYRLDRSGDRNSWTYGSLYKLHIPNYRCYFHGCLGSTSLCLDYKDTKKKSKTPSNRYHGKENRELIRRVAQENIVGDDAGRNKAEGKQTIKRSFDLPTYMEIQSQASSLDKAGTDVRQQILDKSTSLYVQGKGVGKVEVVEEDKPKDPVLVKVAEYNRKLRESPHDVQLWMKFVKFQDTLIDNSDMKSENRNTETDAKHFTRAAIEKKISILDKALESNPGHLDLLLAKLDLCRDMWDAARISKELEQLLFVHPANVKLWRHYLMFNQARMSVFTVSKVTRLYHKCFKTLTSVLEGKLQTHTVPETLAEDLAGIFVQYCYFLKQAGHREKCTATLQAMLEYNLFCPLELESAAKETKMAAFEQFWESACSKLGTKGAKGWKAWNEDRQKEQTQSGSGEDDLEDLEQEIIDKKGEKHQIWLEMETLREGHHWFPWQPDVAQGQTEEDCEDVERLVLFDDVSPALFAVPPALHQDLVMTYVDILGLKSGSKLKLKSNLLAECTSEFKLSCSALPTLPSSCFKHEDGNVGKAEQDLCKPVIDFVVNLLEQVIGISKGESKLKLTLALIEVQLQKYYQQKKDLSKSDKKEMRKIVKSVLKEEENRNNLFLWMAYIDLEKVIGKPGEAQSVAETALAMYSGVSVQDCTDIVSGLISLCGLYCDILLNMQDKLPTSLWERTNPVSMDARKKVMSVINCLIEGKKFNAGSLETLSSTETLKVSAKICKLVDSICEELNNSVDIQHLEVLQTKFQSLCWCYGLFTYCAKDLTAGLSVLEKTMSMIQSKRDKDLCKELLNMQLRLILYHMSTSSASLHILRENLDRALSMYPEEEAFICLFIDIERKCRISGRFSRFFDSHISKSPDSPVVVVLAVCAQLKYLQQLSAHGARGGESSEGSVGSSALVHRTRRWLERCLSQTEQQHCPLLWRLYLQLEMEVGNATRLKGIFYRAIQQCPWVKSLYLEGIRVLDAAQLQELVDLMVEKELRVQIPVEELDILLSP